MFKGNEASLSMFKGNETLKLELGPLERALDIVTGGRDRL